MFCPPENPSTRWEPARATATIPGALIGLALCLGFLAAAQQPSAPRYPQPPIWPGTGAPPPGMEHQYVFRTRGGDALIIRVPPGSEYVRSGKPADLRYDLHNRLEPSIVAQMTRSSTGYVFDYTISNAPSAKDAIQMWWLIIPAGSEQLTIRGSNNWHGGISVPAIIRQVELPSEPLGRLVMWVQDDISGKVYPGRSQTGFHIESSCRPGFTTALFGSGILVPWDQELPEEVFQQAKFYEDPTSGKVPALTFGPMFCLGATPASIVQNFVAGVARFIELRQLDPNSAFVSDVLSSLQSGKSTIGHKPTGAVEGEVFTALQLTLSFQVEARE